MLRFPLERRLAAIDAEHAAEKPSEAFPFYAAGTSGCSHAGVDHNYVFDAGFFGVRLRPNVDSRS